MADSGQKTRTATAGVSATVQVDAVPTAQRSDGTSDSEIRFRTSVNEAARSGGSSGMTRTLDSSQMGEQSSTMQMQELDRLRKEIANLAKICKLQQDALANDQREIRRLQQGRPLGAAGAKSGGGVANRSSQESTRVDTAVTADTGAGAQSPPGPNGTLTVPFSAAGGLGASTGQMVGQAARSAQSGRAESPTTGDTQRNTTALRLQRAMRAALFEQAPSLVQGMTQAEVNAGVAAAIRGVVGSGGPSPMARRVAAPPAAEQKFGPKIATEAPGLVSSPGAAADKSPEFASEPPPPSLVARDMPGENGVGQMPSRVERKSGAMAATEPPSGMRQYGVQPQLAAVTWVSSETPVPPALRTEVFILPASPDIEDAEVPFVSVPLWRNNP